MNTYWFQLGNETLILSTFAVKGIDINMAWENARFLCQKWLDEGVYQLYSCN